MDGSVNVGVFAENGSLTHWNILADGVSGRVKPNDDKVFYLKDHLGSTRAVIDEAGDIQESHDFYPFGLEMPGRDFVSGSPTTNELFTGKERDSETDLDYFGARYYDASIGRWLSVDPLAEKSPNLTPYHYTRNNPLNYTDPDGLEEFKVTVRTFIPYANVLGFKGDSRGSTTAENASFRTSHSVRVETNPKISENPLINDDGGRVSKTHLGGLSAQGKGEFSTNVVRTDLNKGDNVDLSVTGTATNPFDKTRLFSIDYDFKISITPGENGIPNVNISGSHDGFPAYEINVTNEAGQVFQIYYNGVEGKWQVIELLPPKDEKVEEEK